jgi:hypothetical protein
MFSIVAKRAAMIAVIGALSAGLSTGTSAQAGTTGTAGTTGPAGRVLFLSPQSSPNLYMGVQDGYVVLEDRQVQEWFFIPQGTHYEIANLNSNLCLTGGLNADVQLFLAECNSPHYQLWDTVLTPETDAVYAIKNVDSGLYINVKGGSTQPGAPVIVWGWTYDTNNFWFGTIDRD